MRVDFTDAPLLLSRESDSRLAIAFCFSRKAEAQLEIDPGVPLTGHARPAMEMRRACRAACMPAIGLAIVLVPAGAFASTPGSIDSSFGNNGRVLTSFGGPSQPKSWGPSSARSVAIGNGGRILVAGGPPFAVARYKPSGELDDSFSQDGKATVKFATGKTGSAWPGSANAVAIGEHGTVVAVGAAGGRPTHRRPTAFAIARFNSNGALDRSLSGNGKLWLPRFGRHDVAKAVALDEQGRILIAGQAGSGGTIVRLNAGGEPDQTFGEDGRIYVPVPGGFNSMAIDSHGRIVAAAGSDKSLYRFEPDGKPDLSFGAHGRSSGVGGAGFIAIDPHDRIIVADYDTVFRLDEHGFGAASLAAPAAVRVTVDSKQRTVAFGALDGRELCVSRYLPGWDYDPTLDQATVNFPGKRFVPGGVTTDSKDRIIGVGGARDRFALARLHG
jgi:uncharacterized delta-60 repeat protein